MPLVIRGKAEHIEHMWIFHRPQVSQAVFGFNSYGGQKIPSVVICEFESSPIWKNPLSSRNASNTVQALKLLGAEVRRWKQLMQERTAVVM